MNQHGHIKTYGIKNTAQFGALLAILAISLFTSCEKEVHINLQNAAPQVVVQGSIETGGVPYVILTSSLGFFSTVDLGTLEKSFIHGADVRVSDGSRSIKLMEYTFDTGTTFKFNIYSVDTSNLANIMLGETGKFYTLTVVYDGRTYTSVTKIPTPQGIDSAWFDTPQFMGSKTPDSAKQLFVNYTDPDTPGDNVRYFTSRQGDLFYPSGTFSDEIVNGKTINKIGLVAGYQGNGSTAGDSLIYFFKGETVTLKWCAIDKGVYQFYNSLDFAKSAVGNPFSSPINPISNIKNGALGVWAGYGVYSVTLTVP
jgi:hypothetical protein